MDKKITVVGAGPAGLAAAITLARAGRKVVIHESAKEVGHRFQGDHQGLENWSTQQDALDFLKAHGINTGFSNLPCNHVMAFDAYEICHHIRSEQPFFYLLERGPESTTLDSAMLNQALELGVEVRFNSRIDHASSPSILATGPGADSGPVNAISVGYHFETDMADGFWVICNDAVAPGGYSYTLIMNGRGTVKSCMFSDFNQQKNYVEQTVEAFTQCMGLRMRNARHHGGVGHFMLPTTAVDDGRLKIGEAAGFQDALWGFGVRYAIHSGVLAARSILEERDFDALWKKELYPLMETSAVNRAIYKRLGNRGYAIFLHRIKKQKDPRHYLFAHYNPSQLKTMLRPLSR